MSIIIIIISIIKANQRFSVHKSDYLKFRTILIEIDCSVCVPARASKQWSVAFFFFPPKMEIRIFRVGRSRNVLEIMKDSAIKQSRTPMESVFFHVYLQTFDALDCSMLHAMILKTKRFVFSYHCFAFYSLCWPSLSRYVLYLLGRKYGECTRLRTFQVSKVCFHSLWLHTSTCRKPTNCLTSCFEIFLRLCLFLRVFFRQLWLNYI